MHGYLSGHYHRLEKANPKTVLSNYQAPQMTQGPRDVTSRFGLKLRELRRTRNMTQLRMAVDFGIDRSFISDLERGRKSVSLPTLEILALGLEVSLSDLFDGI
jgi:DNA-binding XRE family transcriptional regulator